MTKPSVKTDILIAGAGMTGLALALALSDLGYEVELVDPQPEPDLPLDQLIANRLEQLYASRVSALTRGSEQLLRNLGVWDQILNCRIEPYQRMHVWDGDTRGEISFDAAEVHQPCLGHIVENQWIQLALLQKALKDPAIHIRFATQISHIQQPEAGRRVVQLSDDSICSAQLLVAADGAYSKTRKLAGLTTHEWDYGQDAVVATLEVENRHQDCCWQCFTSDGPLALLPLADPHRVSLVWSTSPDHAQALVAAEESAFCSEIQTSVQSALGKVLSVQDRQSIRLRQRHAKRYVDDQLALIGDAAHTIHPLAGQGVNLGFQDVGALVEVLQQAQGRGEPIGSQSVLRRYQRERQIENLKMSAAMEGFKRLFMPQPPAIELVRSIGMRWVDQSGPLKQHLILEAMGLTGSAPELLKVKH